MLQSNFKSILMQHNRKCLLVATSLHEIKHRQLLENSKLTGTRRVCCLLMQAGVEGRVCSFQCQNATVQFHSRVPFIKHSRNSQHILGHLPYNARIFLLVHHGLILLNVGKVETFPH